MKSHKTLTKLLFRAFLLISLPLVVASCGSPATMGGKTTSLASTTIQTSSRSSVDEAVKYVFQEEGFSLLNQTPSEFRFRKWGGFATVAKYGSLQSEGVAIEPEVTVRPKGQGVYLVECEVYMREHSGHELLDTNRRLRISGKFAYGGLMKKIKKRAESRR